MEVRRMASHLNMRHSKFSFNTCSFLTVILSMACAIEDRETDSVVITGGGADERYKAKSTVSVYNVLGWQEDLPPLITGRYNHACTSYTSDKGTRVRRCDVGRKYCSDIFIFAGFSRQWGCSWKS